MASQRYSFRMHMHICSLFRHSFLHKQEEIKSFTIPHMDTQDVYLASIYFFSFVML